MEVVQAACLITRKPETAMFGGNKSMSTVYLYCRGGRDEKALVFYSIPAIVENQGMRTTELSLKRRKSLIARIQEWAPS